MQDFTELLKSIGTPAGMLAALVFFLSRAGNFLAPMVEKLFAAHCGMVESLKSAVEKTQPMLTEQHGMITDIHEVVVPQKQISDTVRRRDGDVAADLSTGK